MTEALRLEQPLPPALRLFLGAAGAFAIACPAWEFRTALLHPAMASIPFAVILLGAWSVGGVFVAASIAGEAMSWRIEDGLLTLRRTSLLGVRVQRIRTEDVAVTEIVTVQWDSRPDSYAVRLRLHAGRPIETPDVSTRPAAEALERDIR
ncbi:MAG: hypothetical protein ABW042_07785, partial [Phenylobacterium sp.]